MNFPQKLSMLMELRGINGKQLATKTGISRSSICLYLKGERIPKQSQIYRLAEVLKTNPSYLLGLSNDIYIPIISPQNSLVNDKETEMKRAIINEITEIISYQDLDNLKTILGIIKAVAK